MLFPGPGTGLKPHAPSLIPLVSTHQGLLLATISQFLRFETWQPPWPPLSPHHKSLTKSSLVFYTRLDLYMMTLLSSPSLMQWSYLSLTLGLKNSSDNNFKRLLLSESPCSSISSSLSYKPLQRDLPQVQPCFCHSPLLLQPLHLPNRNQAQFGRKWVMSTKSHMGELLPGCIST